MNSFEPFEKLLSSIEEMKHNFVIKDFTGFLNWESSLGAVLLPYTGHHSPFCQSIKRNPYLYARCCACSYCHQKLCERRKEPFSRPCFVLLTEYAVPILIDDICIGSISVGLYCSDQEAAKEKLYVLASKYDADFSDLWEKYLISINAYLPSEESCAVFRFIAAYLGERLRPYRNRAIAVSNDANSLDAGFENILNYLYRNYTNPNISISSIAEACGYSPSYISHTFSKRMKTNIRTYINQLRIVLAKRELLSSHSVSLTAMICGYNDVNYFSRIFQQMVGIPPSQYARNARKNKKSLSSSLSEYKPLPDMDNNT